MRQCVNFAKADAQKITAEFATPYGLDFAIMAFCVFLVIRLMAKLMPKKPAKETRKCPFCQMAIDDKATRCPHCTSELGEAKAQ